MTPVRGFGETGIDPQTNRFNAEFEEVELGQIFHETLGDAVKRVGPVRCVRVGALFPADISDRMDRAGIDHPFDAVTACGLVDVVTALDGRLEDLLPGPLDRCGAEMDHRIAPLDDRHDLIEVAQFARHHFFARPRLIHLGPVAQPDRGGQRPQPLTQDFAQHPAGAGDKQSVETWHAQSSIVFCGRHHRQRRR